LLQCRDFAQRLLAGLEEAPVAGQQVAALAGLEVDYALLEFVGEAEALGRFDEAVVARLQRRKRVERGQPRADHDRQQDGAADQDDCEEAEPGPLHRCLR
jgi:hypothetical protein